jgi:HK97 family phage portal protein
MSLFFRERRTPDPGPGMPLWPMRNASSWSSVEITSDTARRHSAVWRCQMLRADLVSSLPLYVYRGSELQVKQRIPTPPALLNPGSDCDITEWLYSSQMSLDDCGNAFGLIVGRDRWGLPAQIELQDASTVSLRIDRDTGRRRYNIGGHEYDPIEVWHERQFTTAGHPLGMSPVQYAEWSIGQGLSAAKFGLDWFRNGATPSSWFKNVARKLTADESDGVKRKFMSAIGMREPLITGNDWEYKAISVAANESQFLDTGRLSIQDVCRFYGVPSDMIGEGGTGSSLTYANREDRALDFLAFTMNGILTRRERALSRLTPSPHTVAFDRNKLLATDRLARAKAVQLEIAAHTLTPDEGRLESDRPPLSPADVAQLPPWGVTTVAPPPEKP